VKPNKCKEACKSKEVRKCKEVRRCKEVSKCEESRNEKTPQAPRSLQMQTINAPEKPKNANKSASAKNSTNWKNKQMQRN